MNEHLEELKRWFPSGTAEGEKSILDRVFVYVEEFSKTIAPPKGNPHLLIGAKGSGKSAIIDFALRVLNYQNVPAILLTPFDIDTRNLDTNCSTGDMARSFYDTLMISIATKLSEDDTGLLEGDKATLYHQAVNAGSKSPGFVGKMGRALADIAKPLIKIDLNAAFPHLTNTTRDELDNAVGQVIGENSFYLFIDDTDQIANPDQPGHLNRVWALLLAVRKLTTNIPEVKAIVSLRNEVWERLKFEGGGQRDQTDHFNSLIVKLKSDRENVGKIIDRRLTWAANAIKKFGDQYSPFFEGQDARAPYSEDRRSWKDLIVVRSRERPRDAIQLVNELARTASNDGKSLIDEDTFRSVMPIFSKRIAGEFAKEVELECPEAMSILRTFADADYDAGGFTLSSEETLKHFKKTISKFSVKLHGISRNQMNEGDIFELWRFFYLSSVLNARISDNQAREGYRHLDPEKDPMFVSKSRWNELQKVLWEINTVYRDFLISIQNEAKTIIGLPTKAPRKNKRKGGRRR